MAYPPLQRRLELLGIAVFPVLAVVGAMRLDGTPLQLALAALAGWLAADLMSGLVHWALDEFGSVRTPVIGPILIRPFREHHADAAAMTRHDFVETNGAAAFGGSLMLLIAELALSGLAHAAAFFTSLGILAANQCHKWAHQQARPWLVRAAQRVRLIIPPEVHLRHHAAPHDCHYCTASGWLNRPLDFVLRAWR